MSNYVPDYMLDPPEPEIRIAHDCVLCNNPIYEGDDYYDIPDLGVCCTNCIEDSRRYSAEIDDGADDEFDAMREEALL